MPCVKSFPARVHHLQYFLEDTITATAILSNFIEKKLPFFRVRFTYFLYHHFPKKVLLYSNVLVRNVISRSSVRRLHSPSSNSGSLRLRPPSSYVTFCIQNRQHSFVTSGTMIRDCVFKSIAQIEDPFLKW